MSQVPAPASDSRPQASPSPARARGGAEGTRPLRVLSLGAGVQSTTVLLMSCQGLLPRLDAAVFSDTQWEPAEVYEHLDWLTEDAARSGIPVHRVTNGDLRRHTLEGFVGGSAARGERYASLPLFVRNPDGTRGMVRRQCTREYKIVPIERFIRRELLGLASGERAPREAVDQWFGISADEMRRVRISRDHWKRHIYPLTGLHEGYLDRPYTRHRCEHWLRTHYPHRLVPRSACIGCPYHTNAEWRRIKLQPEQWADAIEVDRAIRHADGMDGEVYLHRDCIPLEQVDLRTDEDRGQMAFDFRAECLGYCGN